jgi:2'-5' RNA ligase
MPATRAVERDDPVAWRRGRTRYGVWVLEADTAPVRERLALVRAHCGDWLWPTQRLPHVTVWVGGFLCDRPALDDDLPPTALAARQAALREALLPPFRLEVGGPATFEAAAYLRVADPGGALDRLRALLQDGRGEFRDTPYVPHVTVGLYRRSVPMADVVRRLSACRVMPLDLAVTAVHFVSYDAAVIDGPLRTECSIPLG